MSVVWDDEIKAFIDRESGRLIAPRLDEDGIDFFFVENRDAKEARARYCSGEGYWAFPFTKEEIEQVLHDYKPLVKHIEKLDSKDIVKLLIRKEVRE